MITKDTLIQKLQDKTAKIGILGMGYVGMPLAVVFAEQIHPSPNSDGTL